MQFKSFAFFLILCSLLLSGCGNSNENKEEKVEKNTVSVIKKIKLETTDKNTLNLKYNINNLQIEELKNKAVLLNFFATWCNPCKSEIPHLVKLKEKYKDQFEIVAILLEENKSHEEIQNFMKEFNINYIVANSKANYRLAKVLGGVKSIPTMFMFNKNGELVQKYVGVVPEEMMETDIKKAIK